MKKYPKFVVGLTPSSTRILKYLSDNDEGYARKMAADLGVTQPGLHQALTKLEKAGWVKSEYRAHGRRWFSLSKPPEYDSIFGVPVAQLVDIMYLAWTKETNETSDNGSNENNNGGTSP